MGRLGRDPESRSTGNGTSVATFSLAVDAGKDKAADWFDIVCWRELAETVCQHLTKGRQVAVSGRLQTRSYETKDGQKRKAVEIVANRVDFLGPKPEGGSRRSDADDGEPPF